MNRSYWVAAALMVLALLPTSALRAETSSGVPVVDLSSYKPDCGVTVRAEKTTLRLTWPIEGVTFGSLTFQLSPGEPLIQEMGLAESANAPSRTLLQKVNPLTILTVGVRDLSKQGWMVFFDNPPKRPHETFVAMLEKQKIRVESHGRHTSVIIDTLAAGPFTGDLRFTVYANCPLIHAEAVMSTQKDACAILYEAGLTSAAPQWDSLVYGQDAEHEVTVPRDEAPARPIAVTFRAIAAQSAGGSVAIFPPPHQFLYPLDFADNFKLAWHGRLPADRGGEIGFGVRQPPDGDGRFVPWINAPPGTMQHLGVFYRLSAENGSRSLFRVRELTHGDRFPQLDGFKTFTSHYHIEHTLDFLSQQKQQKTDGVPKGLEEPPFVQAFKMHGVDIAHLAEFHVQHTPQMNADRLKLLKTLHDECRRVSNERFLVLPGEEPNVQLGGHWISLFPRPVYWELHPKKNTPFERTVEGFGKIYAINSPQDVLRLMEQENGLMWTAHARTKSSFGFPDKYRDEPFFRSDHFLGAAWKAMPADLSKPRLGTRVLDLMDDMANWGQRKNVIGEVDVFKIRPDSELYGHMNINYVRLDKLPRFDDGWQPLLDALRAGKFFVTTGEVLIPKFTINGKESGETLRLTSNSHVKVAASLEWTFPLAFAEVIWGDGEKVFRKQADLSDEPSMSEKSLEIDVDLAGAKWVRFEAWDIAANGAFTQPVWIE